MRVVQLLPELAQLRMDGMLFENAAAEEGMMPEGNDARICMLGQIFLQPQIFFRTCVTTPKARCRAVRIQGDDVPHAERETVITLLRGTGLSAPIFKVRRTVLRTVVLVVARSWVRSILKAPPSFVIAVGELRVRAFFIGQITRSKDLAGNLLNKFCRR